MITDFEELCVICNKKATDVHHLIPGTSGRRLADEDGLTIPLCRECHDRIHNDNKMLVLTKIIGQLAYERNYLINKYQLPFDDLSTECRVSFMERYGKGWI